MVSSCVSGGKSAMVPMSSCVQLTFGLECCDEDIMMVCY